MDDGGAGPAVVFAAGPIGFAVRAPLSGVDLDAAVPHPGTGVALWLHADDAQSCTTTWTRPASRSAPPRSTARSAAPSPSVTPTATP
nr:hypothetical protein [Actinoplanes utahensis]